MQKQNGRTLWKACSVFAGLVVVAGAQPARADYLYDLTAPDDYNTQIEFLEPTILTSSFLVTNFLVNSSTEGPVTEASFAPDSSDICFVTPPGGGFVSAVGPCFILVYANAVVTLGGVPTYTSVGTFETTYDMLTITATPEPTTLLLLGSAGPLAYGLRKRIGIVRD